METISWLVLDFSNVDTIHTGTGCLCPVWVWDVYPVQGAYVQSESEMCTWYRVPMSSLRCVLGTGCLCPVWVWDVYSLGQSTCEMCFPWASLHVRCVFPGPVYVWDVCSLGQSTCEMCIPCDSLHVRCVFPGLVYVWDVYSLGQSMCEMCIPWASLCVRCVFPGPVYVWDMYSLGQSMCEMCIPWDSLRVTSGMSLSRSTYTAFTCQTFTIWMVINDLTQQY